MKRKLVLENGLIFLGNSFGSSQEKICEIVFNTSMVGYQEIISDPSYHKQMVVMSYPLIGNYGITNEDFESKNPSIGGLIVREYNDKPSNFRHTKTLNDVMKEHNIVGIEGVDTRKLIRTIRNEGSMKAIITDEEVPNEICLKKLKEYTYPNNQVEEVTCKQIWRMRTSQAKYNVVAIDCGMKANILNRLTQKGCNITIVPASTTYEEIISYKPDGIFISNGPGDPENVTVVIDVIKNSIDKYPLFGICLGHQLIALANNAKTYKMKFGHRGGNHPVCNLLTNKVEITSQNHSYAVVSDSLKNTNLIPTHINLLDNTIEGLQHKSCPTFSVQYHPESAPGPQDSDYLFDIFIDNMKQFRRKQNA